MAQEQAKLAELINADAYGRDGMKLLMTLPGVGAATAQAMMAAIGDIRRFESPLKLASYFGLVPTVHQSAERAYHGKITKQGNSNVRWLLVEVAHHAGRHPGPLGHHFLRIARKGVQVARVAIARKLAVLAWHLLTKGEPYRYASPERSGRANAFTLVLRAGLRVTRICDLVRCGPPDGVLQFTTIWLSV